MSSGIEGTPIVIREELYTYLANKARDKDITIKKYANDLLTTILKRYAYLEKHFPSIKLEGIGSGVMILRDASKGKPVTVVVMVNRNGNEIKCMLHDSSSCEHVRYAIMCPDINQILMPEGLDSNDNAEDSHHKHNNNKRLLASITTI
jgi:hypothetical protein